MHVLDIKHSMPHLSTSSDSALMPAQSEGIFFSSQEVLFYSRRCNSLLQLVDLYSRGLPRAPTRKTVSAGMLNASNHGEETHENTNENAKNNK